MIKTKIKRGLVGLLSVLMLTGVFPSAAYSSAAVQGYGLNTVAGQSTVLRTSKAIAGQDVVFDVSQPDGKVISVSAVTNSNGVAITEFSDYYTKSSGVYKVGVRYVDSGTLGSLSSFEVFPASLSLINSIISPDDQVVRTDEMGEVTVSIKDDYGNPVEGHFLNLVSSDGSDTKAMMSDSNGEAVFLLHSSSPGLKSYTVSDLTSDQKLSGEARILYVDSSFNIFDGYYPSLASMGNGSGAIDSFEFEDVPTTVNPSELYSLTVTAIDADEETVTSYDGTIGFVITSDNSAFAETPVTYEYELSDQGSHTFSLAFKFLDLGSYTLKVADLENTDITAEHVFVVTEADGAPSTTTGGGLAITNPSAGTVSNNTLVISGTADPAANLKIYDNDVEIADISVGVSGEFSHTTGLLNDGPHTIHLAELNDVGTIVDTSDPVIVIVDTQGAEISSVIVDPSDTLDPGEAFKVKLYVDDTLSKAQMLLSGNVHDMDFNLGGFYELDVAAPIEFGDYDIDFILIDELGNQAKFEKEASISVGEAPEPVVAVVLGPENVTSITATPEDSRVILTWTAPQAGDNPIVRYRVYYGTEATQLSEAVDTFTDSTTWYIPDLINGQLYYFGVLAIDGLGNTSSTFGHIAATAPTSAIIVADMVDPAIENGSAGEEAIEEMEEDVSDSGPGIWGLALFSLVGGFLYITGRRKRSRF
jgi:hypothetical protein